jgi:RNA polymerase sigma-70 factor (ECF subfamily)
VTAPAPPSVDVFEAHRGLLFGVAYRMLGSVADAEDIVQEAYLRFRGANRDAVRDPRSYLVTVATRLCLDEMKSARRRRERYVGPWLPEPLPTSNGRAEWAPEDCIERDETISIAYLLLLERLGPVERAVFLLREVFDYDYAEIAPVVGRNEATCRQVFRRARAKIERARGHGPTQAEQREMLFRFVQAVANDDMTELLSIISDDVAAVSDSGGKASAARRVVSGAVRVARFLLGAARKEPPGSKNAATSEMLELNGVPSMVNRDLEGRVTTALSLELRDGRVQAVWIHRNPDKLARL